MSKIKKINSEQTENINYTIRDLDIKDIIPNTFDNFIVTIFEEHHTIVLPSHIVGMQFKTWSRGRGGIFSKDVLNYSLNKSCAKYILFKDDKIMMIIRLIDQEELETFKILNLVDGQIKDSYYMILRVLNDGDKLTSTNIKISDNELMYESEISSLSQIKVSHNEDVDYHVSSVSLFNE